MSEDKLLRGKDHFEVHDPELFEYIEKLPRIEAEKFWCSIQSYVVGFYNYHERQRYEREQILGEYENDCTIEDY